MSTSVLLLAPLEYGSELSKDVPPVELGPVDPVRSKPYVANKPPFMTSTWHKDPTKRSISNLPGWVAYQTMFKGDARPREGKPAAQPVWKEHAFIFPRAIALMVIQYISMKYFRLSWPMWMAMIVYSIAFVAYVTMLAFHMNALALKHGFLDGQVPRDRIPDARLQSTMLGLFFVTTVRPLFCCFVAYDRFETPHITPWLPVHMFLYTIMMDFWFYVYHRAMHEVDFLWKYHKTHHMTKHPSSLLSAFADHEEELIGILIIPLLAYVVYPVDFPPLWLSSVYITYGEVIGHSGIRLHMQQPIAGPVLRPFGMDLIGEDHDLHHRNGWRKSSNYGKQTKIWDKLLGTARPRVELFEENVQCILHTFKAIVRI